MKEAMKQIISEIDALPEGLEGYFSDAFADNLAKVREALAQPEQEPVMVLPDGGAFGVMSFPLPDDHWLYAPNEYRDGEHEPIDLPKPVLTRPFRDAVVAAVRYAVRGATMRGQETDFDPDALVQNAVYALCGPYITPPAQPPQRTEPVIDKSAAIRIATVLGWTPPRTWVGLTDEEMTEIVTDIDVDWGDLLWKVVCLTKIVETKLKERNQ